jgi:hypothetical protein
VSDDLQRALDRIRERIESAEGRRGLHPPQARDEEGRFAPQKPATISDALRRLAAGSAESPQATNAAARLAAPPPKPTGVDARAFRAAVQRLIRPAGSLSQAVGDYRERTRGVHRSGKFEGYLPPVTRPK